MALGNNILTPPAPHFPTPKTLLEQGQALTISCGEMWGWKGKGDRKDLMSPSSSIHSLQHAGHETPPGLALDFWTQPACSGHPAPPPEGLALVPGGGEGPWTFPSSLPSRLETGSLFPGPAPFIRDTMCTHSEGLVWHPSPKPFDLRNFSSADLSP